MDWLTIGIAVWFLCGVLAAMIAGRRGNDRTAAFILGIILGPLGVLVAMVQKSAEPVRWDR